MKPTAIALLLTLAACAPSLNLEPQANDPCHAHKTGELARINRAVTTHGPGASVFDRTWHTSNGYRTETWWGYQRAWYVNFTSLHGECRVSRGTT